MVLLLALFGDHLAGRAPEGVDVALGAGPDELSQQLAVGHGSFTPRRRGAAGSMVHPPGLSRDGSDPGGHDRKAVHRHARRAPPRVRARQPRIGLLRGSWPKPFPVNREPDGARGRHPTMMSCTRSGAGVQPPGAERAGPAAASGAGRAGGGECSRGLARGSPRESAVWREVDRSGRDGLNHRISPRAGGPRPLGKRGLGGGRGGQAVGLTGGVPPRRRCPPALPRRRARR